MISYIVRPWQLIVFNIEHNDSIIRKVFVLNLSLQSNKLCVFKP